MTNYLLWEGFDDVKIGEELSYYTDVREVELPQISSQVVS